MLAYRRKILALRRAHSDLLTYGSYTPFSEGGSGEKVLGYEHQGYETGKTAVVLLSFPDREQKEQIESFARREFGVRLEPRI